MKYITEPLNQKEFNELKKEFKEYAKVTVDIEKKELVIGCELHADGEEILLQNGSHQNNIWGGGINFIAKQIDGTAVLNIRPRLNNDGMEILDQNRRSKFFETVEYLIPLK